MATEWSCLRPPTGFLSIMILWHLLERCQWIVQCCLHREHCALYWRLCHRSHMFISSSRVLAPFREKPESWLAVGRRTFPRWDRTSAPVLGRGKKLIVCFVQGYNTMVKRLGVIWLKKSLPSTHSFLLSFFLYWVAKTRSTVITGPCPGRSCPINSPSAAWVVRIPSQQRRICRGSAQWRVTYYYVVLSFLEWRL